MGMVDHADYVGYGVRVERPESLEWWDFTASKPQEGKVTADRFGAYDEHEDFLLISDTYKEISPGNPLFVDPYSASDPKYVARDALLVAAAEELKVKITDQPAWIFMPHEG